MNRGLKNTGLSTQAYKTISTLNTIVYGIVAPSFAWRQSRMLKKQIKIFHIRVYTNRFCIVFFVVAFQVHEREREWKGSPARASAIVLKIGQAGFMFWDLHFVLSFKARQLLAVEYTRKYSTKTAGKTLGWELLNQSPSVVQEYKIQNPRGKLLLPRSQCAKW